MRYTLILCLIFAITSCSQKSKTIPSTPTIPISEVQQKFYSTYSLSSLEFKNIAFQKRHNGYHVGTYTEKDGKFFVNKSYLFYSDSLKKYMDLPLEKATDKDEIDRQLEMYLDTSQNNDYRINYYFGYDGWHADVISALEDREDLTEAQLYSLGRAYSNSANALLSDNYGQAPGAKSFPAALVPDAINKEQLDKYHREIAKAQATFLLLKEKNPRFETLVGPIGIKYANEVMVQLHNTIVYADKYKDDVKLPDNLYADSMLTKLKKVMDSCEKNAILVSFGDNDFYPVLYLQHKLGHRKDLYLVNTSLLGADRYIARATYPQFASPGIKMTVDTSYYKGSVNDFFIVMKGGTTPVTYEELLAVLQSNINNTSPVTKIESDEIALRPGLPLLRFPGNYMVKSDWVLLNILHNLDGRKICFQKPTYGLEYLDELLEKRELVDRYKY